MIYTATLYKKRITWVVELYLSTTPSSITIIDSFGSYNVAFTQTGDRVNFEATNRESTFDVVIDTETKVLHFETDDIDGELGGDILAPTNLTTTRFVIYLPPCDTSLITLDFYNTAGELLTVQSADATPLWVFDNAESTETIEGISVQCVTLRILRSAANTRFLASEATNTWEALRNISFRVVVNGVQKPGVQWRSDLIMDDRFYGKTFYADF